MRHVHHRVYPQHLHTGRFQGGLTGEEGAEDEDKEASRSWSLGRNRGAQSTSPPHFGGSTDQGHFRGGFLARD